MKNTKHLFPVILVLLFISCVIDTQPLGYCIKNCTNDTIFIFLSDKKELNDEIYWDRETMEKLCLDPEDTTVVTVVYLDEQKRYISNYFRTSPNSLSGAFPPIYEDTCYLYVINWDILKEHTLNEIKNNNSYDRRVITKKDFQDHTYNYKKN